MDISDRATGQEEEMRARSESAVRSAAATVELPPVGICYNCKSSVAPGLRFCDSECRDDYQARRNAEVRMGRAAQ